MDDIMSLPDHEFFLALHYKCKDTSYRQYLNEHKEIWGRLKEYRMSNKIDCNPYFERERKSWRNLWGLFSSYKVKGNYNGEHW